MSADVERVLAEVVCRADDSMFHHERTDDFPCWACRKTAAEQAKALAEADAEADMRERIWDFGQRCAQAKKGLRDAQAASERFGDKTNAVRLSGKREGVALVRDYLRALLDGPQ